MKNEDPIHFWLEMKALQYEVGSTRVLQLIS